MKLIVGLLFLIPNLAFAITTANCPGKLTLTYESLKVHDNSTLKKDADKAGRGLDGYFGPQILAERDKLQTAPSFSFQEVIFTLAEKKSGLCSYLREGETKLKGDNETRLFTRAGRDLLRVSLKVENNYYWAYHVVNSLSQSQVDLKNSSAKLSGFFDHGSPQVGMAWVNDVDVSAEK